MGTEAAKVTELGRKVMSLTEALKKQIKAQLDSWEKSLDEARAEAVAKAAKADADRARAETETEFYDKIESARKAIRDARARVDSFADDGEKAWATLKADIEKTVSDVKRSLS